MCYIAYSGLHYTKLHVHWNIYGNLLFNFQMENVRLYKNVRLIQNGRQHALYTSRPQFTRFEIIDESLVCAELIKPKIILNKPIFCGFTILDLSKAYLYNFHYNCIKKTFKEPRVCFSDTDSLMYILKTNCLENELEKIKDWMDFSKLPKTHRLYDDSKRNVPGYFKDEMCSASIKSFCGLHAKSYSILTYDNIQKMAAAGVTRRCHSSLTHAKYLDVLYNNTYSTVRQRSIISKNHELYTIETDKISISAFDPKRYVLEDYIKTLPYGHYKLMS